MPLFVTIISCVSLATLVVSLAVQYNCSRNHERHLSNLVRLQRQNAMRNLYEGMDLDQGSNPFPEGVSDTIVGEN